MPKIQPEMSPGANEKSLGEPVEFSLVSGGALYRLWRRTRLSGDALEFPGRRVVVAILIMWLPLLLLSIAEGHAWGSGVALTFLHDVETHLRLLIAAPLLLLAEFSVHRQVSPIVQRFVTNGLIAPPQRSRFDAAIASALRLRNSVVPELLLIVFVYAVGIPFVWRDQVALDVNSWYATAADGQLHPWLAGWWAGLVSMPIFQFLCLRWYFRFFIWARFLWQVSRMDLELEPAHPDGAAGLNFLGLVQRAYSPILLALGTVLAGMMANRIFYAGAKLLDFRVEIVGTAAVLVFAVVGPLLLFTPQLRAARRKGLAAYGSLGQRYAREFDAKWIRGGASVDEPLLGSADIQSMADLRNSYLVIEGMRMAPFAMRNVLDLTVITLLPIAPLLLTTFSVEQLFDRVLKVLI